jgi:hypothetical protein
MFIIFLGCRAHSIEIHDVKYNKVTDKLMIDMSYFGGCGKNEFKLILARYNKSNPPQIAYRIQNTTPDKCNKKLKSTEAFDVPIEVRNGDFFTFLDDIPRNQSRAGQLGLCVPECNKKSKKLQEMNEKALIDPK